MANVFIKFINLSPINLVFEFINRKEFYFLIEPHLYI